MPTQAKIIQSELQELSALRQAVALMGFDPKRLAQYVADPSDHTCKAILLSALSLDESKLREAGAGNIAGWRAMLARVQASA
jgi:hypothetical protein